MKRVTKRQWQTIQIALDYGEEECSRSWGNSNEPDRIKLLETKLTHIRAARRLVEILVEAQR